MHITPINKNINLSCGHGNNFLSDNYTAGKKAVVATSTLLGVGTSLAILAKKGGYSLKPSKMFKNIKQSYLAKVEYDWKKVVAVGAGSCLGGLVGGYLIDSNKENRKAKNREAIMHFGNIAIPIITVDLLSDKLCKNSSKGVKTLAAFAGIIGGVYLANFVMNKINNVLFQDKSNERGVRLTDFPAHIDDAVVAAGYISKSDLVHKIGRIIPLALMVAGNEVGTAKAKYN